MRELGTQNQIKQINNKALKTGCGDMKKGKIKRTARSPDENARVALRNSVGDLNAQTSDLAPQQANKRFATTGQRNRKQGKMS
jgi:hypothetical protein